MVIMHCPWPTDRLGRRYMFRLVLKGPICHFVKWQIRLFNTQRLGFPNNLISYRDVGIHKIYGYYALLRCGRQTSPNLYRIYIPFVIKWSYIAAAFCKDRYETFITNDRYCHLINEGATIKLLRGWVK